MSMFIWFAIIFTVVYIIYYTVMIMNDLYGKKPEETHKPEEIDVPTTEDVAPPEEVPIAVVESDTGFNIGEDVYETSDIPEEQQAPEQEVIEEAPAEPEKTSVADNIRQITEGRSEPIEVNWEDAVLENELRNLLLKHESDRLGRPTLKTELVHDEI